jgi:electron transfer flavoprotein alpha/beta subunit
MNKKLERWQRDEVARHAWEKFLDSPEAERGIQALESQAVPVIVMGESQEQSAKRQAFQAGFHTAIFLLQKLPQMHFKKVQEQLPEWDHIEPNDDIDE